MEGARWQKLAPGNIPDKMQIVVDVEGWASANPELRKRQWAEMLQMVLNNPMAAQMVNWRTILMETLKIHGKNNPETYVREEPQQNLPPGEGIPSLGAPPGLGQMAGDASASQVRPTFN